MKPTGSVSVLTGSPNWTQRNTTIKWTGWGVPWEEWRGELDVDTIKTHCVHIWNCQRRRHSISNFRRHSVKGESQVIKQDCENTVCTSTFFIAVSVRAGSLLVLSTLVIFRQCLSLNLILAVEWGLMASKLPGPTCFCHHPQPPVLELQSHVAMPRFYMGDLNSDRLASTASTHTHRTTLSKASFLLGSGIATYPQVTLKFCFPILWSDRVTISDFWRLNTKSRTSSRVGKCSTNWTTLITLVV